MTFDWLTATLLEPILGREGLGLADLAATLHAGLLGTYEAVPGRNGRQILLAEFRTAHDRPGARLLDLAAGAVDPFASPTSASRGSKPGLGALPAMWGGVVREGAEHFLLPAGIAIHPSLVALPTAGGGMMLFRAALPEAVAGSAPGRPFAELVSHPATDGLGLAVRRTRPARNEELAHLGESGGTPGGSGQQRWSGPAMVATFRADKTPRRIAYEW